MSVDRCFESNRHSDTRLLADPKGRRAPHAGFSLTRPAMLRYPPALLPRTSPNLARMMSSLSHSSHGPRLTHIDESGRPTMVDVAKKSPSERTATARGRIFVPRIAYELITTASPSPADANSERPASPLEHARAKSKAKGDALTVAQLAAIMGCKRTSDLIPLCHPLPLSHISVQLYPEMHRPSEIARSAVRTPPGGGESGHEAPGEPRYSILCSATVRCEGKTGVEMEALTAVSVGLLTVWDMLKAVAGKEMVIGEIFVSHKAGGKSGDFVRTSS